MTRLYWIVLAVILFILLQTGYLWAVRPLSEGTVNQPEKIEREQEPISRTGFEYSKEPAPPEVEKAIEMERELKREVIKRKRVQEEEVAEESRKIVVEEHPIKKPPGSELFTKRPVTLPEFISAGYSRVFIILGILLILIVLGLMYHIYRHKG